MTGLSSFLDAGRTSIDAAIAMETILRDSGFTELSRSSGTSRGTGASDAGKIGPGETGFLRLEGTLIAVRAGTEPPGRAGMVVAAAHTDSPGLHLKHRSARLSDTFVRVPVEVYGSPILATWLDRDLTVAGRVATRHGDSLCVPVAPHRLQAIIPNLAIHLNREINDSLTYNRQDHLCALFGPVSGGTDASGEGAETGVLPLTGEHTGIEWLMNAIAAHTGIPADDILDAELSLVPADRALITDSGLLCSSRIDNLAGCFSVLEALRRAAATAHTQVAIFYDHEEIGSTTAYGAAGAVTEQFLRRLVTLLGTDTLEDILPRTILISNDAAHGRHPNYRDRHDEGYAPVLGGGPVIKKSAVRRYASELPAVGWIARIARENDIPLQFLQNRSDIPAGSTIGPAVASRLSVTSVDLGIPILAMHSIRETGAVADVTAMASLLTHAFEGDLGEIFDPATPR